MMNDPQHYLPKETTLTVDDICFLGCSYTRGIGLAKKEDRQSSLISKYLKKTEINLAEQGLTNYDMFDHIGRLNFSSDDCIVFLQLTQLSRVKFYDNKTLSIKKTILGNINNYDLRHLLDTYHDKFLLYEFVNRLLLTVKYLRLNKVKFIIWSIARFGIEELDNEIESYLSQFPEYIFLDNSLDGPDSYRVDDGIDGEPGKLGTGHPGPESNKIIASKLTEFYKKLYPQ